MSKTWGGGQTNVCGVFSDGMQGRSSWVLNAKYEFSLFLGTFQSKFWNICYFIQIKYLVFSCMHKQGIIRFLLLKPPAKVLDMHEQEIKLGYKIMAVKWGWKILRIIILNNVKKIQNILKIRGVKGSICWTFSPKGGGQHPPAMALPTLLLFICILFQNLIK